MTIKEFVQYIKRSRSKYKRECVKYTESQNGDYCPLTFVAKAKLGKQFDVSDYLDAAKALGIRKRDAEAIAMSADNSFYRNNGSQRLRNKLLDALGLERDYYPS